MTSSCHFSPATPLGVTFACADSLAQGVVVECSPPRVMAVHAPGAELSREKVNALVHDAIKHINQIDNDPQQNFIPYTPGQAQSLLNRADQIPFRLFGQMCGADPRAKASQSEMESKLEQIEARCGAGSVSSDAKAAAALAKLIFRAVTNPVNGFMASLFRSAPKHGAVLMVGKERVIKRKGVDVNPLVVAATLPNEDAIKLGNELDETTKDIPKEHSNLGSLRNRLLQHVKSVPEWLTSVVVVALDRPCNISLRS